MKSKRSFWLAPLAAVALLPALASPAWSGPRPVGTEFRVNQVTQFKQLNPVAAYNSAGRALVVWENPQQGIRGIFQGGNELALVPNQTLGAIPAQGEVISRKEPALAMLPSGEFLLFWTEEKAYLRVDHFWEDRDILERDIMGQRFDASGAPSGGRFRVNTTTVGYQTIPRATVRNDGEVIVVWASDDRLKGLGEADGLFAQVVTRFGGRVGNELKVTTLRDAATRVPAVAADAQGDFIVAWEGCCLDGDGLGILARLFDRTGTPRGPEFVVNTDRAGRQRRPAVATDRTGKSFLVTWQGYIPSPEPMQTRIFGQFVGSAGNLVGPQLQINQGGDGDLQIAPAVALLPSGGFLVTWMSWINTSPLGVHGVEIDAHGNPIGPEFAVSTGRIYPQYRTALAVSQNGEALSAWQAADGRRLMSITGRRLGSR